MRQRIVLLAVVVPLALLATGARRPQQMYEPAPIKVSDGRSVEDLVQVVETVLTGRGWTVDESKVSEDGNSGQVRSTLHIRVHTLTMEFKINTESIQIVYVDSSKLGFKEKKGVKYIHTNCTTWLKDLERDIHAGLSSR